MLSSGRRSRRWCRHCGSRGRWCRRRSSRGRRRRGFDRLVGLWSILHQHSLKHQADRKQYENAWPPPVPQGQNCQAYYPDSRMQIAPRADQSSLLFALTHSSSASLCRMPASIPQQFYPTLSFLLHPHTQTTRVASGSAEKVRAARHSPGSRSSIPRNGISCVTGKSAVQKHKGQAVVGYTQKRAGSRLGADVEE